MASSRLRVKKLPSNVEATDKQGNVFKGFHIWSDAAPATRKDPDLLFVKCLVLPGSTNTELKCRQIDPPCDEEFTIDVKKNAFNYNANLDHESIYDIGSLPHTNTPCVLDFLKQRFMLGRIYTTAEPLLIAINPFKDLGYSSDKVIKQYRDAVDITKLNPHVFSIAREALDNLCSIGKSQTIIVSGESGAGKTEASKQVMRYFANSKTSNIDTSIQKAVLAGNPMLEAFGNAKTVRNNNSSRFGRFMQLQVAFSTGIEYGSIRNFLLEKSRIVYQAENERSYHVFYQFLKGADAQQKSKYYLKGINDYKFINPTCLNAGNMNDVEEWKVLNEAFAAMGRTPEEVDSVLSIVSGVLLLGNVIITGGEMAAIAPESKEDFVTACKLLFLNSETVEEGVCVKFSTAGTDIVRGRWNEKDAAVLVHSLAKAMYDKLFDWLIKKLNQNIQPPDGFKEFMGMLDIFGFEVFGMNSLEQLFINITNEKLQKNFIDVVFEKETQLYRSEGISTAKLVWTTNVELIGLLMESKPSLITVLEDQCLAPGGSDEKFVSAVYSTLKNDMLLPGKVQPNINFIVVHTIGPIQYNCIGFLNKNKDLLRAELVEAAQASSNPVVQDMFEGVVVQRGKLAKGRLIGSQFINQLTDLMNLINSTDCYFIRCVKPNEEMAPMKYVNSKVLIQLSALSILEALELRNLGYSYRRTFEEFLTQFKFLDLGISGDKNISKAKATEALLKKANISQEKYQIGKTMVFLRNEAIRDVVKRQREFMSAWVPLVTVLEAMIIKKLIVKKLEDVLPGLIRFQAHTRRYIETTS